MTHLEKLRNLMAENSLSALFISSPENRFYGSGFRGSAGSLLILEEEQYLFTDSRYTLAAKEEAKDFTLLSSGKGFYDSLKGLLKKHGVTAVGFEDTSMPFSEYKRLSDALPHIEWVPLGNKLTKLRAVKDAEEIRRIRVAEEIGDRAFTETISQMHAGMSEKEVAFLLETSMRKMGAEKLSFDTIAASGANGALPHAHPTDKLLENGEFVVMDFGCVYEGYCSDMTRTVAIGSVTDEMREAYKHLLVAQECVLGAARPGVGAKDLDTIARGTLKGYGLEQYFTHSLGHGVGVEIHEAPTASPMSEDILVPGMLLTVEPGIYLEGKFGIRIEDLILFSENGVENLTHSTKELLILS